MGHMATLYVRDVPERLYKRLRARANRNGRSLNAEVVALIDESLARDRDAVEITNRLRELAQGLTWESGMPTPEEMIDLGHD